MQHAVQIKVIYKKPLRLQISYASVKNPCLHFANNTPCVVTGPYITAVADTTSLTLPQQCAVSELELTQVTRHNVCVLGLPSSQTWYVPQVGGHLPAGLRSSLHWIQCSGVNRQCDALAVFFITPRAKHSEETVGRIRKEIRAVSVCGRYESG